VRADKWLAKAGPSDVVKTVPESYQLGDKALYLAAFNRAARGVLARRPDADSGPATAVKVLASFDPKIDPAKVKLADTWTNDFAKRANLKYK